MSTVPLPSRPNLEHLKAQAKQLLNAVQAADPNAVARVRVYFPPTADIGLNEAQLVVAREYGFASWAKLKADVESRTAGLNLTEHADKLAKTASRRDTADAVRAMLSAESGLTAATLAAACVAGDSAAVRAFLDTDPALLNAKIAPKDWEPLLYVCYSCLLKESDYRPRLVDTARLLIERGANVNAFWFAAEWNSNEACLYGATGVNDCPEIAELLLKAGADPNDGESLYHATELPTFDCLKLILDYGGDISIWPGVAHLLDREKPDWLRMVLSYAKSPSQIPPVIPFAMRRGRSTECLRILIESGMDLNAPDQGQGDRTPYQVATRLGRTDVIEMLEAAGADTTLSPADAIIGRLAVGRPVDPAEITPQIIAELNAEKPTPTLVVLAERGADVALDALLAADADPNVTDSNGWTGLHHAALHGRLSTVRVLLRHKADPTIVDRVHDGDARGFASHGSQHNKDAAPDVYVQIVKELLDAGANMPEKAWGSPEVAAFLLARGAKLAD